VGGLRAVLESGQTERARLRGSSTRRAMRDPGLFATAAALPFAASWWIRCRLLAALRGLAVTARAVADCNCSARTGRAGQDEVGRPAQVLDEMAATLQRAFARLDAEAGRQAFRARPDRALAQVDDDEGLASTLGHALPLIAPDRPAELLLAYGHATGDRALRTFAVLTTGPAFTVSPGSGRPATPAAAPEPAAATR
jgi:HAMP domain-containing protein